MASSRNRSKKQRDIGLDDLAWKKYLVSLPWVKPESLCLLSENITLEVAKDLTKDKSVDKWSWSRMHLNEQEAALDGVMRKLEEQGIEGVSKDVVQGRLQSAIKDLKTSMCLCLLVGSYYTKDSRGGEEVAGCWVSKYQPDSTRSCISDRQRDTTIRPNQGCMMRVSI